ncbi:MAG: hypothetical protein GY847_12840 [Proteobacteria bacterium]|nr:hypothetical protein [Pseudomonadota bacterium]
MYVALALCLPWFVLTWMGLLAPTQSLILGAISTIFLAFFYLFTAIIILLFVLKPTQVREDVLYGSVCVYLLIGGIFSVIFSFIEILKPGSFFIDPAYNLDGVVDAFDFTYFSFATLTTLGYGDVIPVTTVARSISVLEAIVGVMYLAIIISRLVGLYIAHSRPE